MINYMVIICLLIIVPSYILTVTKKVRADNSTDKITYVFRQDYIRLRGKLHIKTHYFDDVRPSNGFRRACAAVVSADKNLKRVEKWGGLFVHVLRVAGIMDDDIITLYGICVIPFVGICHEHTSPA